MPAPADGDIPDIVAPGRRIAERSKGGKAPANPAMLKRERKWSAATDVPLTNPGEP